MNLFLAEEKEKTAKTSKQSSKKQSTNNQEPLDQVSLC